MLHRAQPEPSLGQALRHEPGDFNYHQRRKERDFFYSWVSTAWGSQEFSLLMAVSYCSDIISYLARNTCHLKVHAVMCLYSTSGWLHPDPCSAWNCEILLLQSSGLNPDGMPASFFWQRWVFLLLMQWQPHCRALKCVLPSSASFWSTESWKNEKCKQQRINLVLQQLAERRYMHVYVVFQKWEVTSPRLWSAALW